MHARPSAFLSAALLAAVGMTAYSAVTHSPDRSAPEVVAESDTAEANRAEQPDPAEGTRSITIRAVGDILIHEDVYLDAQRRAGGTGFNFAPMFDPVRKYLDNADITTANMEVPVAGPGFELSGYPAFNSPPEVIDALKGAGVDIVNNASNHSLDRGTEGLRASISNMRDRGMDYVGGYSSPDDRATPRIIERNDLKVGFLSYTYGTNGIPIPAGEEFAVNLIDPELMRADIKALRPNVDILIVIIHAGEEYEPLPSQAQFDAVNVAREAGADYVQGGHPHVLEPFARFDDAEPGAGAWYSHGNFLHGQWDDRTKVGGIGEYTLTKHPDGRVSLDAIRFMPTYAIGGPHSTQYSVIPLADADDLPYVDAAAARAEVERVMNTYTQVEVVDYLD